VVSPVSWLFICFFVEVVCLEFWEWKFWGVYLEDGTFLVFLYLMWVPGGMLDKFSVCFGVLEVLSRGGWIGWRGDWIWNAWSLSVQVFLGLDFLWVFVSTELTFLWMFLYFLCLCVKKQIAVILLKKASISQVYDFIKCDTFWDQNHS